MLEKSWTGWVDNSIFCYISVFCYRSRMGGKDDVPDSCNAKNGNPFGPFWNNFNIDFDSDEFYGPLQWNERDVDLWKQRLVFVFSLD